MSSPRSRMLYHLDRAIDAATDTDDPDPVEPELVERLRVIRRQYPGEAFYRARHAVDTVTRAVAEAGQ